MPGEQRDAGELRIAYFTESLYPHVDGVSRTLARLFASLESAGVEFRVFSPFVPGRRWGGRGGCGRCATRASPPTPTTG